MGKKRRDREGHKDRVRMMFKNEEWCCFKKRMDFSCGEVKELGLVEGFFFSLVCVKESKRERNNFKMAATSLYERRGRGLV